MNRFTRAIGLMAALLIFAAGAAVPVQARPASQLPAFSHPLQINNRYFPLVPGTTYVYEGMDEHKRSYEEFVVTGRTKTIMGVPTRVIRDTNWENGKIVELTFDWFAQDDAGNVWYFGEYSTQYKNGKVIGHEGSWTAGVNGARPGIVMKANPAVGDTYKQERAPGIAEDTAAVLSLNESLCVSLDCYTRVLKTKEFSPLEPDVVEHKYYAPGIGLIKSLLVAGGEEVSELVKIIR
ncbi:MAG TPA: hypothetical protein VIV15_09350 [Anaerolineales bacterium]